MCSLEEVVNNIIVTVCDGTLSLDYCGGHIVRNVNARSLCWTPETNVMLSVNYTLISNTLFKRHKIIL